VLVIAAFLTKGSMVYRILEFVWEVNLAWAIFNLLPMLPLDGGRIMAALLELVFGKGALRAAYILSIVVAVLIGLLMVWLGSYITLAFCAFFIYLNVQAMRELDRPAPPPLDA
jgi:stage IV sporulation protein FB